MFSELRGYYANAVRVHVNAAGALVRPGKDRQDFGLTAVQHGCGAKATTS